MSVACLLQRRRAPDERIGKINGNVGNTLRLRTGHIAAVRGGDARVERDLGRVE